MQKVVIGRLIHFYMAAYTYAKNWDIQEDWYIFTLASIYIYLWYFVMFQTFLECVRLRTFGRYGLQQIQVDTHYLQLYLWRFVSDEK